MPLLFVAILVASCDKTKGGAGAGFEVEAFAFQDESEKWGLMDMDGNVIVEPRFEGMPTCLINGTFSVWGEDERYDLYSIKDGKGKKLGNYFDMGSFTGKLCPVFDDDGNASYIDKEGKTVYDLKKINGKEVVSAFNHFCGRAMIRLDNGKWGYIDEKGQTAIPFKYFDAWNFSDDVAIVFLKNPERTGAKWALLDKDGNELFTKKFSEMRPNDYSYKGGYLVCTDKNGRSCIIDKKGEVVLKMKDGINIMEVPLNGMFVVYDNDEEKYGLMDLEGNYVLKCKYEMVAYNGMLIAAATDEQRFSLYSTKGEKLARLPRGNVELFDPAFKNADKRLLVGDYEDGYRFVDAEGKEVCDVDIHSTNTGFYWGASCSEGEEYYGEEEYDEEGDYDEEEDYDEE